MIVKENSSLTIPAALFTVAASLLLSTQFKPIARPIAALWSRCYVQGLLFVNSFVKSNDRSDDSNTVVTALYKYPVKSLRTTPCDEVVLDTHGFVGDRRFMLVTPAPVPLWGSFGPDDATHRFLSQRQCPSLARVVVQVVKGGNELLFSTDILPQETCTIAVEPKANAPIYRSTLWGDIVTVQDMGDAIAAFLQKIVSQDDNVPEEWKNNGGAVRLVVQSGTDGRRAKDQFVPSGARSLLGKNPPVHLGDGFPMYVTKCVLARYLYVENSLAQAFSLIASEASLAELNRRIQEKGNDSLPMTRFRPNIVIQGTTPFVEDRMKVIQIGATVFYVVSSCPRCKESCTDQLTGIVTEEPVATMRDFRQPRGAPPDGVYFAVNAIPAPGSAGHTIRVGDTVKVLQWGEPVWGDP